MADKKSKLTKAGKLRKKMGRPSAVLDVELFEDLCGLQCTKLELCEVLKITDKTLDRLVKKEYKKTFSEIYAIKKKLGTISLRRTGFLLAKTNAAVWIFHAKNHLNMKDQPETQIEPEDAAKKMRDVALEMEKATNGINE